jgi:hypothetical protein
MNPIDILQQFAETTERRFFPEQAINAAKVQWLELWPLIEQLMDQFIAQDELSEEQLQQLFFGLMLIADLAFCEAADKVFQLCDADDEFCSDLSELLGDALTESLPTFFYLLAQGDAQPLIRLLQSDKAGMYVKVAALEALFAQLEGLQAATAEDADLAEIDAEQYKAAVVAAIPAMIKNMLLQRQGYALSQLACLCITFGLDQFKHDFAVLLRQNKLDTDVIASRSINHWELSNISMPLASGRVQTAFDIMSLQHWAGFQPKADNASIEAQLAELEALLDLPAKVIRKPLAGRNEPCPCGSGKKYKKCCLG